MYKANSRILILQTQPAASLEATGSRSITLVNRSHSMTAAAAMPSTMSRMPVSAVMVSVAIPVPRVVPAVVSVTTPTAVRVGSVGWLRIVLNGRGIVSLGSAIRLRRVVGWPRSVVPAADLIAAARVITASGGITTLALGLYTGIDRASGKDDESCEKSDSQLHSHKALLTGTCSTCCHAALSQVGHSMHTPIDSTGLTFVSRPFPSSTNMPRIDPFTANLKSERSVIQEAVEQAFLVFWIVLMFENVLNCLSRNRWLMALLTIVVVAIGTNSLFHPLISSVPAATGSGKAHRFALEQVTDVRGLRTRRSQV